MRSDFSRQQPGLELEAPASSAGHVLKSFNTWAYKREQPSDNELLLEVIERRLDRGRPVSFVLYWGKGPRAVAAEPDRACLAYLKGMGSRIRDVYPSGACFTLCLTDTHARLNGHTDAAIDSYYNAIAGLADAHGMRTIRLSNVVDAYESGTTARTEDGDPGISRQVVESLERCASKWYRGDETPEAGARRYLAMNMVERQAVEAMFPDAVFVTFNGRVYRDLFPSSMPIFYMYSLKRGTSVKPWFMDEQGNPYSGVEASFG